MQQRTTGRFDQWVAFPEILADSPIWGHGAGSARSFTRHRGHALTMHSVYLHLGVETGLLGLSMYLILVTCVFVRTLRMRRMTGDTAPLVLMICFLIDGMAHNNFSPLLAVCLGVGILSNDTAGYFVRRPALHPPPPRPQLGHGEMYPSH
jgi:O-antigen ligase